MNNKLKKTTIRKRRVRAKVSGSKQRPRVSVFTSLNFMYVQLIDDAKGETLLSGSDKNLKGSKTERAALLGKDIVVKAKKAGIGEIVFDRGGKRYHGRVKSLAQAMREGGLVF